MSDDDDEARELAERMIRLRERNPEFRRMMETHAPRLDGILTHNETGDTIRTSLVLGAIAAVVAALTSSPIHDLAVGGAVVSALTAAWALVRRVRARRRYR